MTDLAWTNDGKILHAEPAGWPTAKLIDRLPPWAVGFALDTATSPR
jgi:hypothetical protein